MDNQYLCHYGVKGMKWGVRKDRGPKTGRRRSPNVEGGMRVAGNVARAVGRGVVAGGRVAGRGIAIGGRAVGRGVIAGGKAIGSVPNRVQTANASRRRKEALEAIKRGDVETVEKNLKYLSADDIRITMDRMNAEKRLMSEIDKNRERRGAEKVADALNGIGDSKVARAVKKGAAEGLQDVAKTVVKGVATDSGDTASKAIGSGIGSAFTQWAMYKTVGGEMPNYREAFKTGITESLRRQAKEKYNLDLSEQIVNSTRQADESKRQSSMGNPSGVEASPSRRTDSSSSRPINISSGKLTSETKDPYAKAQAAADATRSPGAPSNVTASPTRNTDRSTSRPIDITTGKPAQTRDPYQSAQEKAMKSTSRSGEDNVRNSDAFRNGYQAGYTSASAKGEEEVDKALDKRIGRIRIQ